MILLEMILGVIGLFVFVLAMVFFVGMFDVTPAERYRLRLEKRKKKEGRHAVYKNFR